MQPEIPAMKIAPLCINSNLVISIMTLHHHNRINQNITILTPRLPEQKNKTKKSLMYFVVSVKTRNRTEKFRHIFYHHLVTIKLNRKGVGSVPCKFMTEFWTPLKWFGFRFFRTFDGDYYYKFKQNPRKQIQFGSTATSKLDTNRVQ